MRIRDLYACAEPTISFEFFPPRTREAEETLFSEVVPALKDLGPSFFSVTYGAGGTRDSTEIIGPLLLEYQNAKDWPTLAQEIVKLDRHRHCVIG